MGHSGGGTMALYLALRFPSIVKVAAPFYPSLYISEPDSTMTKPYAAFSQIPPFEETPENLAAVFPTDHQVSEFPLAAPGTRPQPRHLWLLNNLKNGTWLSACQPDGNYAAIDPCTLFTEKAVGLPTIMFVQGDKDDVPGSGIDLVKRAKFELKSSGAKSVWIVPVEGEAHMFDLPPPVGTSDLGPKWQAVLRALNHMRERV